MSQVRALLLTDIVDSTKLSETLGDVKIALLWEAHDRLARDLLPVWRGREIDKTDGMLLLFDSVADAAAYAVAYHRGLAALNPPLKARAGLHVGPVILRENSAADVALGAKPLEVDGIAKPVAARVMSLAQGGQTLLTAAARQGLSETCLRLESHGHWRMKGVSEPIELFEVGDGDAPFVPPPDEDKVHRVVRSGDEWLPVRQIAHNLPQQATSFVGRERELAEVKEFLGSARLVTLLGMGGVGKTRLSLRVVAEVMYDYPDGVWFVDLAPIRDPSFVASEAAEVLRVREEPGRPLAETLCAHLKPRHLLLVLDNCEHLIESAADLAHAILRSAPGVHVIATSREVLRVPGEQIYPVLPLPIPDRPGDIETLLRSTAVRLFVERAQLHKASFSPNERDAPALRELVAGLEGIPLAIELAAARMRTLSIADINARLNDRYKLLTRGGRVLLERQQTLRALVDWSYDLLTADEQTLLNRLSVFAGGFDHAAAEQVCGTDPLAAGDIVDLVSSLTDKSLVIVYEREEGLRYRMLETVRDYAREKLEIDGEAMYLAARHCHHYFSIAKAANHGSKDGQEAEWTRRIKAELDNLRSAMATALAGGVDPVIAVKIAVAMQGYWIHLGLCTEGRNYMQSALALSSVQSSDLAQAHALYVGACLAESQSDYPEARRMLERCLTLRRNLGNPRDIAATLSTLALDMLHAGDPKKARESEAEALELFRQLGDRYGEAICLLHLAQIYAYIAEDAQSCNYLTESLHIARAIGLLDIACECELMFGEIDLDAGNVEEACAHMAHSFEVSVGAGNRKGEAMTLWWLGKADLARGDTESARAKLGKALRSFQAFGMRAELLACLEDHGTLAHCVGAHDDAVRLCATAAASCESLGLVRSPRAERQWRAGLAAMRQSLGSAAFDAAWEQGKSWEIYEAMNFALSYPHPPAIAR